LFIGEGPGEAEDATGTPFIGISGRILETLFSFVSLQFEYLITNTVGCRPMDVVYVGDPTDLDTLEEGVDYEITNRNRNPQPAEIEACKPHIQELIQWWKPEGIVYLGKIASVYKTRLPKLQLYHPAYIARLETKLYTTRKEAHKLNSFIESIRMKTQ
jgi:DNA polymerase